MWAVAGVLPEITLLGFHAGPYGHIVARVLFGADLGVSTEVGVIAWKGI